MKLLLVGDVMLGRTLNEVLQERPPAAPWGDTLPLFCQADWRLCNLECVIADRGEPWSATPKTFHFRSDAKNVFVLLAAAINAVSLANNHTLDFGCDAMLEMLKTLDGAGIQRAGAGADVPEACRPVLANVNDHTVGLLAFTDNQPEWEATEWQAGVRYVPIDLGDDRAVALLQAIRATKGEADFLIVSAHWGPNWGYRPQPHHVPFAHALIDAGADVVFGHSCHVFQGIEIYRGRPILYSTGNFVDDYAVDPVERNDESCIFLLELQEASLRCLRLYPTVIRDYQARLASSHEAEAIRRKLQGLCEEFQTPTRWHPQQRYLEVCTEPS
ncbi:MAG: CapA family protein [Planctomycetes bacterium]|nr:CapA family protein [Planctomycetota bacterium]